MREVKLELRWTARELFPNAGGSIYRPDNANMATNVVSQEEDPEVIVWNRLTDADAFFMLSAKSDHYQKFIMRKPVRTQHEIKDMSKGAFETMIDVRFDYGCSHYLGVWGSPGA